MITIDATGVVTGWNSRAEAIFGWAGQEVLGLRLGELIVPQQHREAHQRGLQRFLETWRTWDLAYRPPAIARFSSNPRGFPLGES